MAKVMCQNCDTVLDSTETIPTDDLNWICEWCD